MSDDSIFVTLHFEAVAPDTPKDAERAVMDAINESGLLADFGKIEVAFDQRVPTLETITGTIAAFKLVFKDMPDTAGNMKRFYYYLRSRLSRQVQVREIKIKTPKGEFLMKTDDPVELETPDFYVMLKPRD
jgi:hypothetical protein